MNLQSDIIYSPTLGVSADFPDISCRTPMFVGVLMCGRCGVGESVWGSCGVKCCGVCELRCLTGAVYRSYSLWELQCVRLAV